MRDDEDRAGFVAALEQSCARTGWQVHAWCLMCNHFHLVVETPRANLSPGMKWFLGTYTQRSNARHRLRGHVFGGRSETDSTKCCPQGDRRSSTRSWSASGGPRGRRARR